ncbi:MAG: phosphotransferase [Gammaproteobacteria bacterium]|nr:phosphotransferase [Gammaproteobacteria bacterium]
MKKVDFHIHTVATVSDSNFNFSMNTLKDYVNIAGLDAIAITNHNLFDLEQFHLIEDTLDIPVLPGIEVNLESCHVLIITESSKRDALNIAAGKIEGMISEPTESITVECLKETFGNLNDYIVIPHYEKKPAISNDTLEKLSEYVTAGEVDSAKKFIRCAKDESRLVPMLFSDVRISDRLVTFPTRSTFIDCGELTLPAIKLCIQDRNKVSLSEKDGNNLFQVLNKGLMISTGLNILLGGRSSGKTYTLDMISTEQENVKYIKQFSLVQMDEKVYEREFNSEIDRRRSRFTDDYLNGFKSVLDDVISIDLEASERDVGKYIDTLLRSAEEADRRDSYSKSALFSETTFKIGDDQTLKDLISSVRQLIENVDYKEIVNKHIAPDTLHALACELIEKLWDKTLEKEKLEYVNGIVKDIKRSLGLRSSAVQVEDVDIYQVAMDSKKINRFEEIVKHLKSEKIIREDNMQGFKVIAKRCAYNRAGELKSTSGKQIAFSNAMKEYDRPYRFLQELLNINGIPEAEIYRYFIKISYEIVNKQGYPVSGGERSEFRLLQEISDAQSFNMLLIDEPESSFDNMFLKSDVNSLIKEISQTMPVIVVTHNSTVGATVGPDYIIYARKELVNGKITHKIYTGHPTDKKLLCSDGTSIASHGIMMNSLEAGKDAYDKRRIGYEAIEN